MKNNFQNESCETNIETEATLYFLVNNVSSDFMKTLSSIPNERGFKMAFLNSASIFKIKISHFCHQNFSKFLRLYMLFP